MLTWKAVHWWLVFALILLHTILLKCQQEEQKIGCYDDERRPQRCRPDFVNAAFNQEVEATNTCGDPPREYCFQTGATGATKTCEICDAHDPVRAHPPSFLTDFNNNDNTTVWQSETMEQNINYPNTVNLTISFKKSFEITYLRLKFQTSRPESFAIFKQTAENGPWVPYQYYSGTCQETFGLPDSNYIRRGDETRVLCTSEFSDISPLVGGNVAFGTTEGRMSGSYQVDENPALQEWITAYGIRIVLYRLNTFGDDIFGDVNVLRSYYYAISDVAVGGRCKCNGHASECVSSTGQGLEERLVCRCEHNTGGVDCQECLPFYRDRPWTRATEERANECQACDCNSLSNRCFFDRQLYEQTGHGGHCIDCHGNTDGPHCELCKPNHYRRLDGRECLPCQCDQIGSHQSQCNDTGICTCKPGVAGAKCDRCEVNFFAFSQRGCRPCGCSVAGSRDNIPSCTAKDGQCSCKEHVERQNCDQCKPGYFNLAEDNKFGCIPCFCFGHSSICTSASDFTKTSVNTDFSRGVGGWTAVTYGGRNVTLEILPTGPNGLGIRQVGQDHIYFVTPPSLTENRDLRLSYDQFLSFSLRLSQEGARASIQDIIIEGRGVSETETIKISVPIFAQSNPVPSREKQEYKFRLHEHPDFQWSPRLNAFDFQRLLSSVTSIKIRVTYIPDGIGYLDNVTLGSAAQISHSPNKALGLPASHVETCQCPPQYIGQYCEDCAPGYRRSVPNGDSLTPCVPCTCHNHSETCDRTTGKCLCQHNTGGDNCEKCASGFYGRATDRTPNDCQPCPCPNDGPCVLVGKDVICVGCAVGYAGTRCEVCADGFFGDPDGNPKTPCRPCSCNNNTDPNAVGNCHSRTGECLKCIHDTTGSACENCLPGFYGDALKKTCQQCDCYPQGTESINGGILDCDKITGQCPCKNNVAGRICSEAPIGFWNLVLGEGGQRCDCDPKGSHNRSCHIDHGQCHCRDGVTGRKCDRCLPNYYGFSATGCRLCNCDPTGSLSLQCDPNTGQCPCQTGVVGKQCNRCQENRFDIAAGCLECAPCYSLVKDAAHNYRTKLDKLEQSLDAVASASVTIDDLAGFKAKMDVLNGQIDELQRSAINAIGVNGISASESANLVGRLDQIMKRVWAIEQKLTNTTALIASGRMFANDAGFVVGEAERLARRCFEALSSTRNYLENDAKDAFLSAQDASTRFGQTSKRMSEIARDARRLADEHEQAANAIIAQADEALNVSRDAMRLLTETVAKKKNNTAILQELHREQSLLQSLQTRVQNLATMAKEDSDKAYSEALDIYTRASGLVVPSINISQMLYQADDIDSNSQTIANQSSDLISGNSDLIDSISAQKAEADRLLASGKAMQQETDSMLGDIDKAKVDADSAILKAENILKEARDTLQTLQQFNTIARQSEADARKAIQDVPQIERDIAAARRRNEEAQGALVNAESDAKRAKEIALSAQKTAEDASKVAGKIRQDSTEAKVFAEGLKARADSLAAEVARTSVEFEELASQAVAEEKTVKDAIDKSGEAKRKVEQARQQTDQAMEMVDEILSQLGGVEEIDEIRLEALAVQLADAEAQLSNANLDGRLRSLTTSRQTQQRVINDYTLELERLRKEVTTIEAIRQSLPETCFNTMRLEP